MYVLPQTSAITTNYEKVRHTSISQTFHYIILLHTTTLRVKSSQTLHPRFVFHLVLLGIHTKVKLRRVKTLIKIGMICTVRYLYIYRERELSVYPYFYQCLLYIACISGVSSFWHILDSEIKLNTTISVLELNIPS